MDAPSISATQAAEKVIEGHNSTENTVELDGSWSLSPRVALRPEPFGALLYHFENRRLSFLKRLELVEVVQGLTYYPTVESALLAHSIPVPQWPAYLAALNNLARTDMICRQSTGQPEENL